MPLSANTLIHFTKSKKMLKSILEENFRVFYCKETVTLKEKVAVYRAPMVSFCDIPLSEVKEHISKYGEYGIGLTREWGSRKQLNPVLYVAKNSMLANSYRLAFNHFVGNKIDSELIEEQKALTDIVRYMKNYEADLVRKGKTWKDYRFSDEREWRFVPHYSESCEIVLTDAVYQKRKAEVVAKIRDLRLEFEPKDIKYIIIKKDSEISEFVGHLLKSQGKKYSHYDVERLTTRILTTEQIRDDM